MKCKHGICEIVRVWPGLIRDLGPWGLELKWTPQLQNVFVEQCCDMRIFILWNFENVIWPYIAMANQSIFLNSMDVTWANFSRKCLPTKKFYPNPETQKQTDLTDRSWFFKCWKMRPQSAQNEDPHLIRTCHCTHRHTHTHVTKWPG